MVACIRTPHHFVYRVVTGTEIACVRCPHVISHGDSYWNEAIRGMVHLPPLLPPALEPATLAETDSDSQSDSGMNEEDEIHSASSFPSSGSGSDSDSDSSDSESNSGSGSDSAIDLTDDTPFTIDLTNEKPPRKYACSHCRKSGHVLKSCPDTFCFSCGLRGHASADSRRCKNHVKKPQKNPNRKPRRFKKVKSEVKSEPVETVVKMEEDSE